ncbi:hypothetical protein AU375_00050 [Methylobacterium radiotolerans]|nr:hypothetical protein AU375_00050 [Methylobacterium radiotolerans]
MSTATGKSLRRIAGGAGVRSAAISSGGGTRPRAAGPVTAASSR